MKFTSHYSQVPQTEQPLETFPQPRTIPEAWDTSDMVSANESGFDLNSNAESTEETGSESWEAH